MSFQRFIFLCLCLCILLQACAAPSTGTETPGSKASTSLAFITDGEHACSTEQRRRLQEAYEMGAIAVHTQAFARRIMAVPEAKWKRYKGEPGEKADFHSYKLTLIQNLKQPGTLRLGCSASAPSSEKTAQGVKLVASKEAVEAHFLPELAGSMWSAIARAYGYGSAPFRQALADQPHDSIDATLQVYLGVDRTILQHHALEKVKIAVNEDQVEVSWPAVDARSVAMVQSRQAYANLDTEERESYLPSPSSTGLEVMQSGDHRDWLPLDETALAVFPGMRIGFRFPITEVCRFILGAQTVEVEANVYYQGAHGMKRTVSVQCR